MLCIHCMKNSQVLTTRVSEELGQELEWLAASTNRTKSWLLLDALNNYIELNRWQIEAIEEGIRAYKNGETVSHQEMLEWFKTWAKNNAG